MAHWKVVIDHLCCYNSDDRVPYRVFTEQIMSIKTVVLPNATEEYPRLHHHLQDQKESKTASWVLQLPLLRPFTLASLLLCLTSSCGFCVTQLHLVSDQTSLLWGEHTQVPIWRRYPDTFSSSVALPFLFSLRTPKMLQTFPADHQSLSVACQYHVERGLTFTSV